MHRQVGFADVALSFRYMDGIGSRLVSPRDAWWFGYKVMAGETPANPATLAKHFLCRVGSLAHHLVQERSSRGRRVEARDVALDRQPDAGVAPLPDQPVDSLALASDNQAHALGQVELPRQRLATRVQRDAPDIRTLDLGDRGRHARHVRDAEQLAGTGAGLDSGRRQWSATVLGKNRAVCAGDFSAPQDRAQVLRVHYRIEGDQQSWTSGEELIKRPAAPGLQLGSHALVHPWSDCVQAIRRHHLDSRQTSELLEARTVTAP